MMGKKKRLCIVVFAVLILVICTCLSLSIERQMTAQVITATITGTSKHTLPIEALIFDGNQYDVYEIEESDGLEGGPRAKVINPNEYTYNENEIVFLSGIQHTCIVYASKPITENALVEKAHEQRKGEAYYLITGIQGEKFSDELDEMQIIQQDGGAALIRAEGGEPYLEAKVRNKLEIYPRCTIFSVSEWQCFYENMPFAALSVVVLFGLFLSACFFCFTLCRYRGNQTILIKAALPSILLQSVFWYLTSIIDLPDFIMPRDNIFDVRHYIGKITEFSQVLLSMEHLVVSQLQKQMENSMALSAAIVLGGIVLCMAVFLYGMRRVKKKLSF